MKCPYNLDIIQQTVENYEYDENGNCIKHITMLNEKQNRLDCIECECAAYQNGICKYKN